MTPESERAFVDDIDKNAMKTIYRLASTIDCGKSKCENEEDKAKIYAAIQKIGFNRINERIFERLKDWVIKRYEKEMEKRKRELGEDHGLVLKGLTVLASLYRNEDKFNEALPLHEDCLEKSNSVLGENHPPILSSFTSLGVLYNREGGYSKALSLFGKYHPATVASLSNLARLYDRNGDYDKTLPLFEECLKKREEVHGKYISPHFVHLMI
jgi:tetratricopeptide (TPR) repeat protein